MGRYVKYIVPMKVRRNVDNSKIKFDCKINVLSAIVQDIIRFAFTGDTINSPRFIRNCRNRKVPYRNEANEL